MLFSPQDFQTTTTRKRRARPNPCPRIPDTGWRMRRDFPDLSAAKRICVDLETKDPGIDDYGAGWGRGVGHIVGAALGTDDGFRFYMPMRHEFPGSENLDPNKVLAYLNDQLGRPNQEKVGHNMLYDLGWLAHEGVVVRGVLHDTWIAQKLLSFEDSASLEALSQRRLGQGKVSDVLYKWAWQYWGEGIKQPSDDKLRKTAMQNLWRSPISLVGDYAESDVDLPIRLLPSMLKDIRNKGLETVYRMECDLLELLVQMRLDGVSVDLDAAERAKEEIEANIVRLQAEIDRLAGRPVNTGSPLDMEKLFTRLKIPFNRTEQGQMQLTGAYFETVTHPIGEKIIEIEELKKYVSTFIKGYILDSNVNGKIHATFNQLKAVTGRMSCVDGDTPILTQRGMLKMREVVVGDLVWTHRNRWRPVKATWLKGVEEMFTVKFAHGDDLTCTTSHRMLSLSGEWKSLKQLTNENYVYLLGPCEQPGDYSKCSESLSRQKDAERYDNSQTTQVVVSHCNSYPQAQYGPTRVRHVEASQESRDEDGRQESYVRKNGFGSPQLAGGLRGRLRIFNENPRGEEALCSSHRDGASLGSITGQVAGEARCSSHRREPEKQQYQQSCSLHEHRPQSNPRETDSRYRVIEIKEVVSAGCREVYDITVDEDESYLSCGVFSHNSSSPNLQNVPSRNELAKIVRAIFIPDKGHVAIAKWDYSSVESRILAHYAVGAGSDELREEYRNNPDTDYHNFTQAMIKRLVGLELPRKHVKNVNFAGIYGASESKLQSMMKLSDEEALSFFTAYHDGLPYVRETMDHISREVQERGYTRTILGRRAMFDKWEPKFTPKKSNGEPWTRPVAYGYEQALRTYGPNIKRAFLHKALNYTIQGSAADLMKAAMVKCWKAGVYDRIGVPRLVVHDENVWSVRADYKIADFLEMQHIMENAIQFRIPIKAAGEIGPNWANTKSV